MDYEYVDESSIDENLKCCICNDPFNEPVTTVCDHTFCFKCIQSWINTNNSCPQCRHRISNIKSLIPMKTRLILNMLDNLLVKCKTCHQTAIQRGNFKDHLKTCRKRNKCSCSASDIRCPWIGPYDQLSVHLSQCPYEQLRPILTEILIENQRLREQLNELNKKNEIRVNVQTITFEPLLTGNKSGSIPNGFIGLKWINVRYTNEENARAIRPNRSDRRISYFTRGYSCVAYNDWKNPMIISSIKQNFTLRACEIMSINHSEDSCQMNIIARRDKIPIHSKTITLQREITKVIEFNSWNDINEIEFVIENTYFILPWIQFEGFNY